MLAEYYEIISKEGYHLSLQLKIQDITLEKGKIIIFYKLRVITLIAGDLQILMRIHLSIKTKELTRKDSRLSKANYRFKKL